MMSADRIIPIINMLISKKSDFITGQDFIIDDGFTLQFDFVEAFLVDQDLEYPNLDETNIIYTNYINFVCSEKSKKLYLFNNKNKFNDENDFSEVFFQNWYRDKESKEYFSNKISIVQILNRLTFFSLLNDIKNFNAIKFWANKFSKITIITESESLKRVCNYFDNVELVIPSGLLQYE